MKEKNKLIAEFMDMQLTDIGWYDSEGVLSLGYTGDNTFDDLLFHTSWDWLMPVVGKIESLGYDVIINGEWCNIHSVELEDDICDISIKGKINAVYIAVVEFIKWFNENKE